MVSPAKSSSGIVQAALAYWSDEASRSGRLRASRSVVAALWEFARGSTPARLRTRFGDADYDWEHRVNTTSAGVGWRDRLLGIFHSPYQPTEPLLFHEMLDTLARRFHFDFGEFTFLDLGSGKGRTLLMASDYPFRRVVGIELLPSLNRIACENLQRYSSDSQRCRALESVCADATSFDLPQEQLLLYLFNPFPESGLRTVIANLERSLRQRPRKVFVLYHNPLLEHVLHNCAALHKVGGTHQYSVFSS